MSIILLGASGFLGTNLLQKLKAENLDVKVMIHNQDVCFSNLFVGDIIKQDALNEHISDDDIIINLIGQYTGNINDFFDQNLQGGYNLLNTTLTKKNIRIILASSITVYGTNPNKPSKEEDTPNPKTNYGVVKLLTENMYDLYSKLFGLDITILRFSNIYGPTKKSGIISKCMESIKNNNKITIYNSGNQVRDFLFIDDAIDGIMKVIKKPQKGYNIFNVSSAKGTSISELLNQIETITGNKVPIILDAKTTDEEFVWADNLNMKKKFEFDPKICLNEGLKLTFMQSK